MECCKKRGRTGQLARRIEQTPTRWTQDINNAAGTRWELKAQKERNGRINGSVKKWSVLEKAKNE